MHGGLKKGHPMDFDSIGAFALFFSTGAIGCTLVWLASYRMKLKADLEKARLDAGGSESIEQLREEMQQLLAEQGTQIDELHERLDFAERLLTQGRAEDAGGGRDR